MSGLKDISKGRAEILDNCRVCFSISRLTLGVMYPAVVSAGCRADAQWSLNMLCAFSLLIHLHLKAWSL